MYTPYYIEEGSPLSPRKLKACKALLTETGLTYDPAVQYTVLLRDAGGAPIATGSRDRDVLKCLAVSPSHQGEGLLASVLSLLQADAHRQGHSHLFLFTKPTNRALFEDLSFYPLVETGEVLLMENAKNGIRDYLEGEKAACPAPAAGAFVGAIVMNADPFTLGHRHLIQKAREACDLLHVFVLSSSRSHFPPRDRLRLVREGCGDLPGVFIHGGSRYLISHATFPDYFQKDKVRAKEANCELDLHLFGRYFKEAFSLTHRFVGEEPLCPVTAGYNAAMERILPQYGIRVRILPRIRQDGAPISASRVRALFAEGKLEELRPLVPESTYRYLLERSQKPKQEA